MLAGGLVAHRAPAFPKYFIYIVGSILLLSTAILALSAYAQTLLSGKYYYDSSVPCFLLFVSIWTWLVYGGMLAIEYCAPRFYFRIIIFVGQLLSIAFWISGWAWATSWAAYVLSFDNYNSYDRIRGAWKAFGHITATCAGIGALTQFSTRIGQRLKYLEAEIAPVPNNISILTELHGPARS
ncbi:hypothetical protein NUW58_g293 [Xylaria curta]|uniref:Uncharacterized protein n=1 Tax=Xylaria curta TaxID=42375 RepID=A0ACC1PPS8_9PEZI|nr:hypothetical protein NUW58_g293 [Xylaria curta]